MRILLIEDDQLIGDGLKVGLEKLGFAVDWFADGLEGEEALYQASYGAVVLDLGLPGQDGLEVLKNWRQKGRAEPVLILTARGDVDQRIAGLNSGADDYLGKPFSLKEVQARLNALIRRSSGGTQELPPGTISQPPFLLNTRNRTLEKNGQRIKLTQVEYSIMRMFMENPGKALSREEILDLVWGRDYFGELKIVDVNVRRLRLKIEDSPTSPTYINTVWGYGYKWGF